MATPRATDWKKRESLLSALLQIGAAAVLLSLAVWFVYQRGARQKAVAGHIAAARAEAISGNPKDLRKALRSVEVALSLDSTSADVFAMASALHTDLWLLHHEPGAEQRAKDFLEKAQRGHSDLEDRWATEARHLLASGDAAAALRFVQGLSRRGASSPRLSLVEAHAHRRLGSLLPARRAFTAALESGWKEPTFACAWGEALLEEGLPGAADAFTKALTTRPDALRARLGLAQTKALRKDRLGEAERMVKEVLATEGDLSPPLRARANSIQAAVAHAQSRHDEAIALATEALAQNPEELWAWVAKGDALAAKRDSAAPSAYASAIAKSKAAAAVYFEGAARLQAAGMSAGATGLLDAYEAFFKEVKNQTAEGAEVPWLERDDRYWVARGDLLRGLDRVDEALQMYDRAIAAKGLHQARATYAKASISLARKDWDSAGKLLFGITPEDGSGPLADAYLAMGEVLFAKREWGAGCQNYAYGLARLKATQAPKEQLQRVLSEVGKRLASAGQTSVAKLWVEQATPLIQ